jgi:propanol-preferring alcohol dehydrogenase
MKTMTLLSPRSIDTNPLTYAQATAPTPGEHELRVCVHACGVCHTDLHIIEGDLPLPQLPIIPGHQVVGHVDQKGISVTRFKLGDRVGVPWLHSTCGRCSYCQEAQENLCDAARFTGYHVNGGYAEYTLVHEDFAYHLPKGFSDLQAAPLLCAGAIGYRALRKCHLAQAIPDGRIGMYGFGASAHVTIQVAHSWGCQVYAFSRSPEHRRHALSLGAIWAGEAQDDPGIKLDASIIFAPAGSLVPHALRRLRKGGVLLLAGITMSPLPEMEYDLIYGERIIHSITNATRSDMEDLLDIAARISIHSDVVTFPLKAANRALQALKYSAIRGAGVLQIKETT